MSNSALIKALILLPIFLLGIMLPPIFNAKANPLPPYEYPEITISSPIPDKTYNTSSIPLNIKIQVFAYTYQSIEKIKILNYSLDGFQATPIEPIYPREYGPGYFISANSQLNSLTEGSHTLLIQGETTYNKHFQKNITFTVDTSKHSISEQSHTSTFTPKSQQSLQLPSTTEIVAIVILIVIALGLAVNIVKKRRS